MTSEVFPKISIVTPSFNQAQFLEETINSVLSQNYPNLEYIIVDGKSTDGSHEIIKNYQDRLLWLNKEDGGMVSAVNKGFRATSGEILALLCSDDVYNIGTLNTVARFFSDNPGVLWITGDCAIINETGKEISKSIRFYKNVFSKLNNRNTLGIVNFISTPSTFIKRELFEKVGFHDENLGYANDFDYWLRCYKWAKPAVIRTPTSLAKFRVHTKSVGGNRFKLQFQEAERVLEMNKVPKIIRILNHYHNNLIVNLYSNYYRKSEAK